MFTKARLCTGRTRLNAAPVRCTVGSARRVRRPARCARPPRRRQGDPGGPGPRAPHLHRRDPRRLRAGPQDRRAHGAARTRGRAPADELGRGGDLLRPARGRARARDAELHLGRPQPEERAGSGGRKTDSHVAAVPGDRQAGGPRRGARQAGRDHPARGRARLRRPRGQALRPGRRLPSAPVSHAGEAVRYGRDPLHLRQLRRAQGRGAEPGESRSRTSSRSPPTSTSIRTGCSSTPCRSSTASA